MKRERERDDDDDDGSFLHHISRTLTLLSTRGMDNDSHWSEPEPSRGLYADVEKQVLRVNVWGIIAFSSLPWVSWSKCLFSPQRFSLDLTKSYEFIPTFCLVTKQVQNIACHDPRSGRSDNSIETHLNESRFENYVK